MCSNGEEVEVEEEFKQNVSESDREKYVILLKEQRYQELVERIDAAKKNILEFQGFIKARPPAYKVDYGGIWYDIVGANSLEGQNFFGRAIYQGKHACFSVEEEVLDEVETYFNNQIEKMKEEIVSAKIELLKLKNPNWIGNLKTQ